MTVGELKELLDDFGDHLPVVLVVNRGENDRHYAEFEVDTTNRSGEPMVTLTAED